MATAVEFEAKKKPAGRLRKQQKTSPSCLFRLTRGRRRDEKVVTKKEVVFPDSSSPSKLPTHLVVTVNGIVGSADNWEYAAKQFVKRYSDDVIVHCSECNTATLTFDGVDVMGERLAKEVRSVVASRPHVKKISFVAHSLGGLIARYAIALLYEQNINISLRENVDCKMNDYKDKESNQKLKGSIAGLEPVNFITFVTPHLGTRAHRQIPIFCGSYMLEKMAYHNCWVVGRTGKHLMLKDKRHGKPPLLFRMVNDCEALKFMSSLQSFARRVTYSNIHYDFIVGWNTSSIRHRHELPKLENLTKNENYPHIVHIEVPKAPDSLFDNFEDMDFDQLRTTSDLEDAMIKALNRVSWEKVAVSFRKSKQRFFAHSTIQVKTYSLNSDGADVISHMIDNFLL